MSHERLKDLANGSPLTPFLGGIGGHDQWWALGPEDRAALKALLEEHDLLKALCAEAEALLRLIIDYPNPQDGPVLRLHKRLAKAIGLKQNAIPWRNR